MQRNNSLRPVTVHQVLNISQAHPDAPLELDGKEIDQVRFYISCSAVTCGKPILTDLPFILLSHSSVAQLTLVGIVTEMNEGTTFSTIQLDDGTGQIPVKVWAEQGMDSEEGNSKLSDIRSGLFSLTLPIANVADSSVLPQNKHVHPLNRYSKKLPEQDESQRRLCATSDGQQRDLLPQISCSIHPSCHHAWRTRCRWWWRSETGRRQNQRNATEHQRSDGRHRD